MINHARTLLLNESPVGRPAVGTCGEEYIPAGFNPQELPGFLASVRSTLLGTFGDPLYQNYRLAQYTAVLHANPYANMVMYLYDQRITYDRGSGLFTFPFDTAVTDVNGLGMSLSVLRDLFASNELGRCLFEWVVSTISGPMVSVKDPKGGVQEEYALTVADTLTNTFPVKAKGASVEGRLTVPTSVVQIGAEWTIEGTAPPTEDLGAILVKMQNIGASTLTALFSGVPDTFKNLWIQGNTLVDRMGAFLAATVWQLEVSRTHG